MRLVHHQPAEQAALVERGERVAQSLAGDHHLRRGVEQLDAGPRLAQLQVHAVARGAGRAETGQVRGRDLGAEREEGQSAARELEVCTGLHRFW